MIKKLLIVFIILLLPNKTFAQDLIKTLSDAFENNSIKVPFVVPNIEQSDKIAIENALKSNLLTDGPNLKKFEKAFSKFTGSKYAIGVSNATSALHLSLKSIGIGKDDEVIIPNITSLGVIVSSISPITSTLIVFGLLIAKV